MFTYLAVVLTFPTLPFGILLGVALLYWLVAATGLIQIDWLDGLFGSESATEASTGEPGGITGPFMRLGLGGVPISVSASLLVLFAWALSYALSVLVGGGFLGAFTMGTGLRIAIFVAAIVGAVPLTALALRPVRRFFARLQAVPQQDILGRTGIVSSPEVTDVRGHVNVDDGGAGLVLQVRSAGRRFVRGDAVRLVEYLPEPNAYRVIPGDDAGGS